MSMDSEVIADSFGMGASALCLVHCLALPLLAPFIPFLDSLADAEWVHVALFLMVAPTAAFALLTGFRHHREIRIPLAGWSGVTLLALPLHEAFHTLDTPLSVAGGMLLIAAHLGNYRLMRKHKHCSHCQTSTPCCVPAEEAT